MRPAGLVRITALRADKSPLGEDHGLYHEAICHMFRPRPESLETPIKLFRLEPAHWAPRGCRK